MRNALRYGILVSVYVTSESTRLFLEPRAFLSCPLFFLPDAFQNGLPEFQQRDVIAVRRKTLAHLVQGFL